MSILKSLDKYSVGHIAKIGIQACGHEYRFYLVPKLSLGMSLFFQILPN